MGRRFTKAEQHLFHTAIAVNDPSRVRAMLDDGISPDVVVDGIVPLYVAACRTPHSERRAMIDLLVQAGADPNRRLMGNDTSIEMRTALNGAVESGDIDSVDRLLEHGADPRQIDNFGRTAAHILLTDINVNTKHVARLLASMLDRGIAINQPDNQGSTLLHYAISKGWPSSIVCLLLDRGADINARCNAGRTPIFSARDREMTELLVHRGADVLNIDVIGKNALRDRMLPATADAADADVALHLLACGADPHRKDYRGVSAADVVARSDSPDSKFADGLRAAIAARDASAAMRGAAARTRPAVSAGPMAAKSLPNNRIPSPDDHERLRPAIKRNELETVRALLAAGISPNDVSGGPLPLYVAAEQASESGEMIDLLLGAGADVNRTMHNMLAAGLRTALNGAADSCNVANVELLLDRGADPRILDHLGRTAAHSLLKGGMLSEDVELIGPTLHRLLDLGILINQRDGEGRTLLHCAVRGGWSLAVVDLLLGRGADINARDATGDTPLFLAANVEMAQGLLDRGADLHSLNNSGENVFFATVRNVVYFGRDPHLALHLLQQGANAHQPDYSGSAAIGTIEKAIEDGSPEAHALLASIRAMHARDAMTRVRERTAQTRRP